ncbi:MAG TPA: sulfatase-like hydrolase/transferase [Candidatus Saccharicenans sp.]|nr:sulfatase-like hydrolase/transferase [Candidatus Saccharicenans sp.]
MKIEKILDKISLTKAIPVIGISSLLLLETLASKYFMLKQAGSYESFLDVLRVSRTDILWLIIISLFLIVLPHFVGGKTFRKTLNIIYALSGIIASLAIIAQLVLFTITGFGLNRDYIQNYLKNPGEVNQMILTVLKDPKAIIVVIITGLFLAFTFLPWDKILRKLPLSNHHNLKRVAIALMVILLIFLEAGVMSPLTGAVNTSITEVPVIELVKSFLPEKEKPDLINIKPEERTDAPIVLEAGPSFNRLNVVLIIFESLSYKYCDVYNPKWGVTPFLEDLSKKGLTVERLYSVVPHTTKALIPIVAGIYPYLQPDVYEAIPGIIPPKSLPYLLKEFGYRTAFFQTANNYEERPSVVANLGYDDYFGLFELPDEGFANVNYFGKEEMMMLKPSLKWIEAEPDKPFFLTYLTLSSHHEYGFPPSFPEKDYKVGKENQNRYLNAVKYTDYFLSQLFEEFRKRGLLEKTVFIILGDHGEAFGEHGREGHNFTLWEEGMRVAGLVYAPALIKQPGVIKGVRSILDVPPTVCDLLGLKVKEGSFIGESFLRPVDENRKLYFSGWSKDICLGMREGRYKYIFMKMNPLPEIYDNYNDPEDKENLYESKKFGQSEIGNHSQELERWALVECQQYKEWRKKAEQNLKLDRKEDYIKTIEANFSDLVSAYGFGIFPEDVEPNRTVSVRVGFRIENKIKKPLRLMTVFKHKGNGQEAIQTLSPRVILEKLKPGEYTTAESIFVVPDDWPAGEVAVYFGVLDVKKEEYIPFKQNRGKKEAELVFLTDLRIHTAKRE